MQVLIPMTMIFNAFNVIRIKNGANLHDCKGKLNHFIE